MPYYGDVYESTEDDWTDLKTNGPDGLVADTGLLYSVGDEPGWDSDVTGWVGESDAIDYMKFTLREADIVSFTVSASDTVKFTIYSLAKDRKGSYSLKALRTVTPAQTQVSQYWDDLNEEWYSGVEPEWSYSATTSPLALAAGDYYFSVESTAKSGGDADYEVANAVPNVPLSLIDLEIDEGTLSWEDPVHYRKLEILSPVKVSLSVYASDSTAKFSLSTLVQDRKGNCSLKSLMSAATTVKLDETEYGSNAYMGSTKSVLLGPGIYYVATESPNAAKGTATNYKLRLNEEESLLYDFNELEEGFSAAGRVDQANPVEYGWFSLEDAAMLSFTVDADAAAKFSLATLVRNSDGTWFMKALQSGSLKKTKVKKYREDGEWVIEEPETEYSLTTSLYTLAPGQYFYYVEAKKNTETDYNLTLNADSVFFDSYGTVDDSFSIDGSLDAEMPAQYGKFVLDDAAKLIFSFGADDAPVKFTLYNIVEDKKGGSSLNALTSGTLKKSKTIKYKEDGEWIVEEPEYAYSMTTSAVLLKPGEYYFSVKTTKKNAETSFTGGLTENSVFFSEGDNSDDDWKLLETNEIDNYETDQVLEDWVGYGDSIDYRKFTIPCAANLSFTLNASDAVKLTFYELDKKAGKLIQIQSFSAAKTKVIKYREDGELIIEEPDWNYSSTFTPVLLDVNAVNEDGDAYGVYYLSVQSTNAAKGGSAEYELYLDEETSAFFDRCDNGDDWTDLATKGDASELITDLGRLDASDAAVIEEGWVGYGDAVDYFKFTVAADSVLSFQVDASDEAKFSVSQLISKNGAWSLKSLQTTKLKKNKVTKYKEDGEWYYEYPDWAYSATTGKLSLKAGTYYLSMLSTNAAKGGNANYQVYLNTDKCILPQADAFLDALDAPELAGSLAMAADLSFGGIEAADLLADASAFDKLAANAASAWQAVAKLA
jgi:hypothetical protein